MSLYGVNRNMMRLSGMQSGLDTDSIVKASMKGTQIKLDRQFRLQKSMEWKQAGYQDINNELRKLKEEFSSVTKQEQNMLSMYNYRKYTVKYSGSTNNANLDIKADPSAKEASYIVKEVTQLAEAANAASSSTVTGAGGKGITMSDSLKAMSEAMIAGGGTGLTFTKEGGSDYLMFNLDGKDFKVNATATVGDMINAVNANAPNVKISYTQLTDKFTLESKKTGAASELKFDDNSFLGAIGITKAGIQAGKDANLVITQGGVDHSIVRDSNNFSIDGINYTLKGTFDDTKSVSFSLERDMDATVDLVKKYVEAYNAVIDKVYNLVNVKLSKTDRSFKPLTEEERAEMSEKQIEQWEEKAKKGIMRNDGPLGGLLNNLRSGVYLKVGGASSTLADMGLGGQPSMQADQELARKDSLMGKILIDETKLREALQTNPDQIFKMFTYKESYNAGVDQADNMGLVQRVNTLFDDYIKTNERVTQKNNETAINRAQKQYDNMVAKMYKEEDRLWAKFSRLETVMAGLNSQSQWMAGQMGGM